MSDTAIGALDIRNTDVVMSYGSFLFFVFINLNFYKQIKEIKFSPFIFTFGSFRLFFVYFCLFHSVLLNKERERAREIVATRFKLIN